MFRFYRRSLVDSRVPLVVVAVLVFSAALNRESVTHALVMEHDGCDWPLDWPAEFDDVQKSCKTFEVAAGNQETVYEFVFKDRDLFERLWFAALSVRSKCARLRLLPVSPFVEGRLFSNEKPTLRIRVPVRSVTCGRLPDGETCSDDQKLIEAGMALRTSGPFPEEVKDADGCLPEYVSSMLDKDGKLQWQVADRECQICGFMHRARIDLELVVDGHVVDLNRIPLPAGGTIVDLRFPKRP